MAEIHSTKVYYPFLDSFRAIAILWVMLHHGMLIASFSYSMPYLDKLSAIGFLGVDIFFVISGFLITGLLINDLDNKIRVKRFYVRRFFKIVPHYLTIVLIGFALLPFNLIPEKPAFVSFASYFLFLQNYVPTIGLLLLRNIFIFYTRSFWF